MLLQGKIFKATGFHLEWGKTNPVSQLPIAPRRVELSGASSLRAGLWGLQMATPGWAPISSLRQPGCALQLVQWNPEILVLESCPGLTRWSLGAGCCKKLWMTMVFYVTFFWGMRRCRHWWKGDLERGELIGHPMTLACSLELPSRTGTIPGHRSWPLGNSTSTVTSCLDARLPLKFATRCTVPRFCLLTPHHPHPPSLCS